jgi:hypothetical protein
MEGDGGGVPTWWEEAGFGRICSTFWRFFRHGTLNLPELS